MRIVEYPHPALRYPGKPVTTIDKKLRLNVGKMFELMYDHEGLGLAATQVALPYQLVVMNITGDADETDGERAYINPKITAKKGLVDDEEGCLSFPGMYVKMKRAKEVTVEAFDLEGNAVTLVARDLEARAWQHELDHLNGVLFIDRFSAVAKLAKRNALKSMENSFRRAQEDGRIPANAEIEKLLRALEEEMSGQVGSNPL